MSLINKMLKDLEVRQGSTTPRADARPIFHDLQPVNAERRRLRALALGLLAAAGLAGAGYFGWMRWAPLPSSVAPVATAPIAIPTPNAADNAAPPVAAAPLTPVSAPAPAPKPATATAAVAAKPAATRATEGKTAPAAKPKAAATQVAKAEPAPTRIEKTERPYSPQEIAENAYRDAARLHALGNPAEAERRLKTLLVAHAKHVQARELLAAIQLDSGRWLEAQDTLEQGVARAPEQLVFRFPLARLYLEHGSEAQAVTLLEAARRDGHTDPELYAFLAALYQRAGRHAEAVKNYQDALSLRPQEGKWWLGLGISLEAQQDGVAARDAYRRALESGRLAANLSGYVEGRLKALAAR